MEYRKLRGLIVERFRKYGDFADAMGYSRQTLSNKLKGRTDFSAREIIKICEVLEIPREDIPLYFFTVGVK